MAIELLYVNYLVIAHNFQVFGVPGVALHAAGGAEMGTAYAPASTKAGVEA